MAKPSFDTCNVAGVVMRMLHGWHGGSARCACCMSVFSAQLAKATEPPPSLHRKQESDFMQRRARAHRMQSPMRVDIGLYGEEAPRSGPLVLEKGLEGRSLDDVLLWLDAVYKQVGPATLEGALR